MGGVSRHMRLRDALAEVSAHGNASVWDARVIVKFQCEDRLGLLKHERYRGL